jgi:hypothetical protein
VWRESFIVEWTLFPCAGFDDQVDATVQYLEWISHNAALPKRERAGFAGMANSRGQQIYGADILADRQVQGVAVSLASRRPWYW